MRRQGFKVVLIAGLFMCLFQGLTDAEVRNVSCTSGGWSYPNGQNVYIGDQIIFRNWYPYSPTIIVYQVSGPCDYWETSAIYYEAADDIYFTACTPGTVVFDTIPYTWGPGALYVSSPPTPTATPDPNIPSMSSSGIGLTLIIFGVIMFVALIPRMR